MNWSITAQIAALVILYVGGIVAIGRYMTSTIITTLGNRINGLDTNLNKRIDDLRDQMKSDHANLANHLTRVEEKLDKHITDYSIHNIKQSNP